MKLNRLMQLLKDNARAEGPAAIRMDATATEAHVYVNDRSRVAATGRNLG